MDKLKKQRRPIRTAITRTVNEVEAELDKEEPDQDILEKRQEKLAELLTDVKDIDKKVIKAMLDNNCDDQQLEKETDDIERFVDKIRDCRIDIRKALIKSEREEAPPTRTGSSRDTERAYKLPKIEIAKFNGDLTGWLPFWSQFKKIHEDAKIPASDKFQYLVQSLVPGSPAKEVVDSFTQSEANYPKAVEALQGRFGNSSKRFTIGFGNMDVRCHNHCQ
jgi:vacuolar-type H+-ATPase subunit I/STV1